MTGLIGDIMERRFWNNWERKFNLNYRSYINPDDPVVTETAESLPVSEASSDRKIVNTIWGHIRDKCEYNLTKRWRRPSETLSENIGDCEDYVFAFGSLLPHFGVTNFTVVAGEVTFDGQTEFHVWMRVNGRTVDPTSPKEKVAKMEYVPELTFDVQTQNQ